MKLKIQVQNDGATGVYIVTYKLGKFLKLEHKRGKISKKQFDALMQIVPPTLEELEEYQKKYHRVIYEKIFPDTKSLFKTLLDIYHTWYHQQTGITPRINATSGMQLTQIIAYLKTQTTDEQEIQLVFSQILERWPTLPDFYQNQREIRQINSNLNILLNHIKNGQTDSKSKSKSVSEDLRQSI